MATSHHGATDESGKLEQTVLGKRDERLTRNLEKRGQQQPAAAKAKAKGPAKAKAKGKAKAKVTAKAKAKGSGKGSGPLKTPFVANQAQLCSLDNAWRQGTGRGPDRLAIKNTPTFHPLEKGEKRKYKADSRLRTRTAAVREGVHSTVGDRVDG